MGLGKQAKTLSRGQIGATLAYLATARHANRNRLIFLLSAKAGLRAKEIAKLTWLMTNDSQGDIASTIQLQDSASKGKSKRIRDRCCDCGRYAISEQHTHQCLVLSEEKMVDVRLATFYVFDRESGVGGVTQVARGCGGWRGGGGCGGECRGCGGGCGCQLGRLSRRLRLRRLLRIAGRLLSKSDSGQRRIGTPRCPSSGVFTESG